MGIHTNAEQDFKADLDMLYLTVCAVNEKIPDIHRIEQMNLKTLFHRCQVHTLTACAAYALESAGVKNHDFIQAKEKAIRKNILLDAEREKILSCLEQEKIWHLPLKGALLKDWYPKLGMRQMSDNDILCDAAFRQKIKELMLKMGFSCEHFGMNSDDAYFKPPVYNFEMHHELFTSASKKEFYKYYRHIKEKLIKDNHYSYRYHFQPEDFYIYMTAHEYKHFLEGGIGVRALADVYVFMKKFHQELDWNYLSTEFQKLNLLDYEQKRRKLAEKIFQSKEITPQEHTMLEYYLSSGAYGVMENCVKNNLEKNEQSKSKYLFHRLFPSMGEIETYWNFFYRNKWLIPVLWVYRPIHALFSKKKRDRIQSELHHLKKK